MLGDLGTNGQNYYIGRKAAELSDFKRGPSGAREFEPEVKAMLEREKQDFS